MVFIIAEIGVNHNGDLNLAFQLIDAAKRAGADAVKFQTFKADLLASKSAPKAKYQENNKQESQYEMLKKLELSKEDFFEIKKYCDDLRINFFSTPFDLQSVDLLKEIGVEIYKIGSADLTNYLLLEKVVATGKKIILSTGASNMEEVETAVEFIKSRKFDVDLSLLHCVSSYPTKEEDLNLMCIKILNTLGYPVGFSDHTSGITASMLAISLGASIIEKHITLDNKMEGPDHSSSMNPENFEKFVRELRNTEIILGNGVKIFRDSERDVRFVARRSLAYSRNMEIGEKIKQEDLIPLRPLSGICVSRFQDYLGKVLSENVSENQFLSDDHF